MITTNIIALGSGDSMYKKPIGIPLDDIIEEKIRDYLDDLEVEYNIWIDFQWDYRD